jgi:biopolymer transport protein TolQ
MLSALLQRTSTVPEGTVPGADTAGPAAQAAGDAANKVVELDPISIVLSARGPVFLVIWLLIFASVLVWFITVLKLMQLKRWRDAEMAFERDAARCDDPDALFSLATRHRRAPGARVVLELQKRRDNPKVLESTAKRAVVEEQRRVSGLMPMLASIGSAAPFVGLFGTVWGIMDAFLRIGREKSASLPVVAPAIGEALIATAIGLFAAIPAVVAYNALSKKLDDLLSAIETASEGWAEVVRPTEEQSRRDHHTPAVPLQRAAHKPAFPGV